MNHPNTDPLAMLNTLSSIVVELVTHHNVKHETIVDHIQKTIEDSVKDLPMIHIIYNTSYGGYRISDNFREYVLELKQCNKLNNDMNDMTSKEARIHFAKYIKDYGQYIIDNHINIWDIVTTCTLSNVQEAINASRIIHTNRETLENITSNLDIIDKRIQQNYSIYDTCEKNKTTPNEYMLSIKPDQLLLSVKYSIEDLKEFRKTINLDEIRKKYIDSTYKIMNGELWMGFPDFIQNVLLIKRPQINTNDRVFKERKKCFMDALMMERETETCNVWEYQTFYNVETMTFLADVYQNNTPVYEYFASRLKISNCIYGVDSIIENIGLMCASASYSKLGIDMIPPLLDWYIHDYDGREEIRIIGQIC